MKNYLGAFRKDNLPQKGDKESLLKEELSRFTIKMNSGWKYVRCQQKKTIKHKQKNIKNLEKKKKSNVLHDKLIPKIKFSNYSKDSSNLSWNSNSLALGTWQNSSNILLANLKGKTLEKIFKEKETEEIVFPRY